MSNLVEASSSSEVESNSAKCDFCAGDDKLPLLQAKKVCSNHIETCRQFLAEKEKENEVLDDIEQGYLFSTAVCKDCGNKVATMRKIKEAMTCEEVIKLMCKKCVIQCTNDLIGAKRKRTKKNVERSVESGSIYDPVGGTSSFRFGYD